MLLKGLRVVFFLYITPTLFNEVSYVFITIGGGGDCSNVLCKISNAFVYPQCLENNPKHSNNFLFDLIITYDTYQCLLESNSIMT